MVFAIPEQWQENLSVKVRTNHNAFKLKPKASQLVAAQDREILVDLKERPCIPLLITMTSLRPDLMLEASFFFSFLYDPLHQRNCHNN